MYARLATVMGTLLMAFGVLQGGSTASMVAIAVVSLVIASYAGRVVVRGEFVTRVAAHVRRQAQRGVAAPQHPHTPGRRRSRAPSVRPSAAQ